VIVSHNLGTIAELCDRVVWLHDGKIKKVGGTKEVIKKYKEFMEVKNDKK
jgi:teichoic acid transport system ATP-binding protein